MRLFLDANVLFSAAHNPRGNARALFALARKAQVALHTSQFAREEAARNIVVKFPACRQSLSDLLEQVKQTREPPPRLVASAMVVGLPKKDAPILAAAVAAEVDVLVTGDKRHFGPFFGQRVEDVLVLPPLEALALGLEQRDSAD
jgi:predicted nucleic acid-binding protein